ncbi:lysoplasmalogenase [Streptomyces populi]|uniref:Lysoplasmalogenase n=1 Tax=Streptomyces populi TaxID=2058924 RepID=A0A2I0SS64_9ACTN|nr:lysoplasmalogenase [Streptomyces populi]PKT72762.1 lysoplasmalogenase [Streptomyces populi]
MNPRAARVLLVCFALTAAVDLLSLLAGADSAHRIAKALLMPLLAAHAGVRGAPRLLLAALLLGWCGDLALLSDADPAFLAGMASFAAGHVCYLVLFRRTARARDARLVLAYATALAVLVVLLWPGLPAGLRVPVAGYSLLLTAMAYGATRLGPVAALGGILFMLSDTLIATGVADWPQLPKAAFWIMLTYIAAQFLLVRGVLGPLAARRATVTAYGEVRSTTP